MNQRRGKHPHAPGFVPYKIKVDQLAIELTTLRERAEQAERALSEALASIDEHVKYENALRTQLHAAQEALEAILYVSDQCQGHANCGHSMEPWKRARELLAISPRLTTETFDPSEPSPTPQPRSTPAASE